MDRRLFLLSATGALAGCYQKPPAQVWKGPVDLGVDAHVHLFNGRDVPVTGFLQQVVFSTDRAPFPPGTPLASLVLLLVQILRSGTPTAAQELRGIPARGRADDQQSVAAGIDAFRQQAGAQTMAGRTGARQAGPLRDDALLLDMLLAEATGAGAGARTMARSSPPGGAELAQLIYHPPAQARISSARSAAPAAGSSLIGMVQWAGLLTRGRGDLMAEMLRLYRGSPPGQVQVFISSLVDLELWLDSNAADSAAMSPLEDQIRVMSRLAQRERNALILNFAPFCPLRAVVEGRPAFDRLRRAVEEFGFCGVKLYPPMGFRATCNQGISFAHSQHPHGVTGAQIDDALQRLYDWCTTLDVPLQAHANDSMAAAPGTGAYASPVYWQQVLKQWPKLRLNLSHAGELKPSSPQPATVCGIKPETDWLAVIARMIREDRQVWFDTGYWTDEAAEPGARTRTIARLRALEIQAPGLAQRMLYGSDWTMIAQMPGFAGYHVGMRDFIDALYPDADRRRQNAVMGGNALDFLLGPMGNQGAQYRRLARFYADNQIWQRRFTG